MGTWSLEAEDLCGGVIQHVWYLDPTHTLSLQPVCIWPASRSWDGIHLIHLYWLCFKLDVINAHPDNLARIWSFITC